MGNIEINRKMELIFIHFSLKPTQFLSSLGVAAQQPIKSYYYKLIKSYMFYLYCLFGLFCLVAAPGKQSKAFAEHGEQCRTNTSLRTGIFQV